MVRLRVFVPESIDRNEMERQAKLLDPECTITRFGLETAVLGPVTDLPVWLFWDLTVVPPEWEEWQVNVTSWFYGAVRYEVDFPDELVAELQKYPNRL